jgi:hypothetical protein
MLVSGIMTSNCSSRAPVGLATSYTLTRSLQHQVAPLSRPHDGRVLRVACVWCVSSRNNNDVKGSFF